MFYFYSQIFNYVNASYIIVAILLVRNDEIKMFNQKLSLYH